MLLLKFVIKLSLCLTIYLFFYWMITPSKNHLIPLSSLEVAGAPEMTQLFKSINQPLSSFCFFTASINSEYLSLHRITRQIRNHDNIKWKKLFMAL